MAQPVLGQIMETKDLNHWYESDRIYAHGIGVKLEPVDMEALMQCVCPTPDFDVFDICKTCDRKRKRDRK
jgi:hypothetical protein